ncbi:Hypothetical predicted protein [Lecanosticta acicola]|uniref:Uncharacterized protein n=1 Tax=Lecanosticta acicola TaxID=111012 RepID=A0AAI8YZK9_9PEZI|nr:Hypothetical predicted protein [Lecanosticta acicola]
MMKTSFLLAVFLTYLHSALALPQQAAAYPLTYYNDENPTTEEVHHDPLHPGVPIAPGSGGVRFSPYQDRDQDQGLQPVHVPISPASGGVRPPPDSNQNLQLVHIPINPASGGVRLSPNQEGAE